MSSNWVKAGTFTYADFSAASTTGTKTVFIPPKDGQRKYIEDVRLVLNTAFSGGAISAYTISIGISGSVTKYMAAKNVFTGATDLDVFGGGATAESDAAGTAIIATATSTSANTDAATAGSCTIYVLYGNLPA